MYRKQSKRFDAKYLGDQEGSLKKEKETGEKKKTKGEKRVKDQRGSKKPY